MMALIDKITIAKAINISKVAIPAFNFLPVGNCSRFSSLISIFLIISSVAMEIASSCGNKLAIIPLTSHLKQLIGF